MTRSKLHYKDLLQQRKEHVLKYRNLLLSRMRINKEIRDIKGEMDSLDNYLVNEVDFE